MSIMRALLLTMIVGALAGCAVENSQHYDRSNGYSDFRSEGPHGLDTLDRPD